MPVTVPSYLASRIVRRLPRKTIGQLVGRVCDARLPPAVCRAVIDLFCRVYDIDLSEVEPQTRPYESIDAFFTRRLAQGSRPVSRVPGDVVSPADGVLQSIGRIDPGCRIVVKKKSYDVARLVGDECLARAMVGGQFAVVYLSPRDYHRVHAPVSGTVSTVRGIAGELYPVNGVGEVCSRALLVGNKRVVIDIDTQTIGHVVVVLVGAMVVGRISVGSLPFMDVPDGVHALEPPFVLEPGDEIGAFHLGSTAVVLVGSEACSWCRPVGPIRVGESLVRL